MVQQCNPIKRILQDKNYSLFLTNGNEKDFFFVTKKHSNSGKKKNNTKNEVLRVQESTLQTESLGFFIGDLQAIAHENKSTDFFGFIYDNDNH